MIFLIIPIYQRNFQFTIKSNLWFLYFCLILQCDWSRKVVLLSGIIRFKSKNDCHLATYIFPCYEQFSWFYWEFILAHCYVLLCSDWLVAVITLHLVLWHPIEMHSCSKQTMWIYILIIHSIKYFCSHVIGLNVSCNQKLPT